MNEEYAEKAKLNWWAIKAMVRQGVWSVALLKGKSQRWEYFHEWECYTNSYLISINLKYVQIACMY